MSMMGPASVKLRDTRIAEVITSTAHTSVLISGHSYIFAALWTVKFYGRTVLMCCRFPKCLMCGIVSFIYIYIFHCCCASSNSGWIIFLEYQA